MGSISYISMNKVKFKNTDNLLLKQVTDQETVTNSVTMNTPNA